MEAKKLIALLEAKLKAKYADSKEELKLSVTIEVRYGMQGSKLTQEFKAFGYVFYMVSVYKCRGDEGYIEPHSYFVPKAASVAELISRFDQEVNGYKKTEKLDLE